MAFAYPVAFRDDTAVNVYHGTPVPDPYVWLEDPDSAKTKAFIDAQNAITTPYIEGTPVREKFSTRMTELYDYPKYSCPFKRGNRYYYYHNTGLQNQSVMYVQETLGGESSVFLDPNSLSADGTVALQGAAFSECGSLFAYGLSSAGSDWVTVKFLRAGTGEPLADSLSRVKFTCLAWTHDARGLFYNQYPESDGLGDGTETSCNLNQKLYYHVIGTDQSQDILCAEFPDNPKWMGGAKVSHDGRYVLLSIREGCDPVNRLWYCDLQELTGGITGLLPWVKLIDNFDAEYEYVTSEGSVVTFRTNLEAPRYKLITVDLADAAPDRWGALVDQHERDVLDWAVCVRGDVLVLCWLRDVAGVLEARSARDGSLLGPFPLPLGSVLGFSGRKNQTEIFYQHSSFLTPGVIYRCDLTEEPFSPEVYRTTSVKGFRPSDYETTQVFYTSKDGSRIPMFLVHKKGIVLDGSHPTLLYGYGGFNISITPTYSVSRLIFIHHLGGVLAVANLRGGGEYGEEWHRAGMLSRKQNVFDDFVSAAEFLIAEKYTRPDKLVIQGASNGGLLVAACVNQRPELFGCALAEVGVMDMLKFHTFTIGHAWTTEYGSADDREQFQWLIKYSPLHNVRAGVRYPAMLLLTADHDDRVSPLHSLKLLATLQAAAAATAADAADAAGGGAGRAAQPILLRCDTKAGHGSGKPTAKVIAEAADAFSFAARALGLSWRE
uniref:Prolyl endopeptidase n=1 Tax=Petromyzon marinus TaxID=7757 RepID=A0AAJ7UDR1_PETMA|nr:prolyl endopeptidase [Petromyzon marinus]